MFLFLPSSSSVWLLCALLAVCANIGFGASVVAMNAYLPTLAKNSPEVVIISDDLQDHPEHDIDIDNRDDFIHDEHASADDPLLPAPPTELIQESRKTYDMVLSNAMSRISSLGIALGYAAGILLLILALVPVTKLQGSTFSLRLAIGLSGIWYVYSCNY